MAYDDPKTYLPYRKKSSSGSGCSGCGKSSSDCGCDKEEDCGCEEEDCGCCPNGLVAVYDDEGHHVACLTPNDAEEYTKNTYKCEDGYVKVLKTSTGEFFGCVSEENFESIYNTVNPA